ncbi:MAG: VOC family protein [Bacteroidota bacterium]
MPINIPKISTQLCFESNAEDAANFYTSIFKDSEILATYRYGENEPGAPGSVCYVIFRIAGQEFFAVNGGPSFKFSQGISLYVNCDTQDEIDELWEKLSEGGQVQACGWLVDKFGVSWQIEAGIVWDMLKDTGTDGARRALQAVWSMTKIDIETIKRAYAGA